MYEVSPWHIKEPLNELIQRTIDHGLKNYFQRKTARILKILQNKNSNNKPTLESSLTQITMTELHFVFIIYLFGIVLSGLVFFGEHKLF